MGIRSKATLLVAAVLVATTAGTARADTGREAIQQGLDEVVQAGVLGVQVRVTSGREHFTARSGKAELGSNRPVPLNGRFRAASVTKTFTATVVLQLVGEGKLDLDASVDRYLPGLIDQQRELTRTTALSPAYGLGLQVLTLPCGTTVWGHDGGVPGFASLVLTTPDAKKRVALSAGTSPNVGDPSSGLEQVLGEVFC